MTQTPTRKRWNGAANRPGRTVAFPWHPPLDTATTTATRYATTVIVKDLSVAVPSPCRRRWALQDMPVLRQVGIDIIPRSGPGPHRIASQCIIGAWVLVCFIVWVSASLESESLRLESFRFADWLVVIAHWVRACFVVIMRRSRFGPCMFSPPQISPVPSPACHNMKKGRSARGELPDRDEGAPRELALGPQLNQSVVAAEFSKTNIG